ncbi:MAG: hypothetical protein ACOC58_00075 [Chloroflexota bacterium]
MAYLQVHQCFTSGQENWYQPRTHFQAGETMGVFAQWTPSLAMAVTMSVLFRGQTYSYTWSEGANFTASRVLGIPIPADCPTGTYPVRVTISGYGETYTYDLSVTISGVGVGISATIHMVLYWYTGLTAWGKLSQGVPSVPMGTALHIAVQWVNNGIVPVSGSVSLTVTSPDGTTLTPAMRSWVEGPVAPGVGAYTEFEPFTLDQVGSYQGRAVLEGAAA